MNLRFNIFLMILVSLGSLFAQSPNLVYNGSFESSSEYVISTWRSCDEVSPGDIMLDGWVTPLHTSPDYFNSDRSTCNGGELVLARTGEGRCGMIFGFSGYYTGDNNYREYLLGRLTEPLVAGKKYDVKFYIALDKHCSYGVKDIGCYLSNDEFIGQYPYTLYLDPNANPDDIYGNCSNRYNSCNDGCCDMLLRYQPNPQISYTNVISSANGWQEISGIYTASGGERYITIGNFSHQKCAYVQAPALGSASSHITGNAYYFVDDVSIREHFETMQEETVENQKTYDYFLFLLDISNSMNQAGYLQSMKTEIENFQDNLNSDAKIAIMAFNNECKLILPFTSTTNDDLILSKLANLKAGGNTNGDHAILRAIDYMDSLHLRGSYHVVLATDGEFAITDVTEGYTETILQRDHSDIWILKFGSHKNGALMELANEIPKSYYVQAKKKNIDKLFTQLKNIPKEHVIIHRNLNEVRYTW